MTRSPLVPSDRSWSRARPAVRLLLVTAACAVTAAGSAFLGSAGAGAAEPAGVSVCGTSLCAAGSAWTMHGATVYNPGLQPYQSGIKDPAGTIALAEQAHLNTIRVTNFLNVDGNPSRAPYNRTSWRAVDALIAAAGAAGMHVDLGLSDYRDMLWNHCNDPYTTDWTQFISFVANRVNTVTHVVYKDDPTIAFVSVAGEPLPVGTHQYTSPKGRRSCSVTYSASDLTDFYAFTTAEWVHQGGTVLINSGGLSYLDEPSSGIDWKSIFSLPTNAFCDIKTYGGMLAWAPTATAYCQSIGKPVVVEEFGWVQGMGDAARAQSFETMYTTLRSLHVAGMAFWNLGYQLGPTSYEVNPSTPDTFFVVAANAP
jgi:mannan endo-1,4-beta-mannosidase